MISFKGKSNRVFKSFIALLVLISILTTPLGFNITKAQPRNSNEVNVGATEKMKDGAILHAWCWSFNTIKDNMKNIANAGYTSIQTSPINTSVVGNGGDLKFRDQWWYHYQPTEFKIGNYQLGTEAEFASMCAEAKKHGIRIIVDVVANHFTSDYNSISQNVKNIPNFFRTNQQIRNWGDRREVTQLSLLGLWDINTHNPASQQYVKSYLQRCVELGASGFRYDAAKHVELPDDHGFGSNFWPIVLNNGAEFQYGEVLQDPISRDDAYSSYMSLTASNYGMKLRDNVGKNNFNAGTLMGYDSSVNPDKLVTWVESHDTYANAISDWGSSQWMTDEQIKLAWAVTAARAEGTPLFFSRPVGGGGKNWDNRFPEVTRIGDRGSDLFMNDEIAAVNKFRNAMNGESENLRNLNNNNQILMIERGAKGLVIVNGSYENMQINTQTNLAGGNYTNRTNDNSQFTVSNGTISGRLPARSVIVLYKGNEIVDPIDPPGPTEDTRFYFEKPDNWGSNINAYIYDETNGVKQVASWPGVSMVKENNNLYSYSLETDYTNPLIIFTDGHNQIPGAQQKGFELVNEATYDTSGIKKITGRVIVKYVDESGNDIKASIMIKDTIGNSYTTKATVIDGYTLKETPANAAGKYTQADIIVTYVYEKNTDPVEPIDGINFYFEKPTGWGSNINVYIYDETNGVEEVASWPGVSMVKENNNLYSYSLETDYTNPLIIFTDGHNQVPGAQQKGFELVNEATYDTSGIKKISGRVIVKYVDESGNDIKASIMIKDTIGNSYTTKARVIDGYTLKETPANAAGKYTQADIIVTYVYEENAIVNEPEITASLATGSTFKTETQKVTLGLKNAVSGTYSVDNGPEKTFIDTRDLVIGQGKIADSIVTVKATAKALDGRTKSYTFTYNKQFSETINEEEGVIQSRSVTPFRSPEVSSTNLASQYATNANGIGAKKTITIDGSLSGWDKSMLIAQGAANDDPRVYRENSMYEVPIDTYAMYGAYDDNNLYLMWEMTNVQDVVAPNDDYPLSQGILYQTMNVPFYIAIDTGNKNTAIGNKGKLSTGLGTLWDSGITYENSFNKLIAISTNGANGPYIYGGDSTGLNPVEEYKPKLTGIKFNYGLGILSDKVIGINGAYGSNNNRIVGDVANNTADWVDFNTLGHNSKTMDFHYEMAIPLDKLGVTSADVQTKGIGVLLVATMGLSGMDCLPYDRSMNDNANLPDTASQEFNSYEKSDEDHITSSFARIGKAGGETTPDPNPETMKLNFGAEHSSPQATGTALMLEGIVHGGTAPYTYNYYINGELLDAKSSSSSTQALWTPDMAGNYVIKCVVTDNAGKSVTSSKLYTIEGTESDLNITGTASVSNVAVGEKVIFTARASGGSGDYTYRFMVFNKDTNESYTFSDFKKSNTLTWTAPSDGSRAFFVEVKDSTGKVVKSSEIAVMVSKKK